MNFNLSAEHLRKREEYRQFTQEHIKPRAKEIDEQKKFPREALQEMAARGYMGLPLPREWGGKGDDFLSYVFLIEEISKACPSTGGILSVHTSVGTYPILYYGTETQKNKYLSRLASGEWLGAFALTETQAGSDAGAISTTARFENEYYYLNGSKVFITNGGEADVYTVFATVDSSKGKRGITAFLVDKDTPGLIIGTKEEKMGLNGSTTVELVFEDARVPVNNRLGKEGEGFPIALSLLDGGRIGIAAQALGIASASLEYALEFTRQREQFGQKVFDFQGVSCTLADYFTRLEAARLMVYRAGWLKSMGEKCTKESSMAKVISTDLAMDASARSVSLMGARGGLKEHPVEKFFRDSKVTQIYEGTNQIQRMVIAREVLNQT